MNPFKPCAVIPVYNHEHALPLVVDALRQHGLPCVLVDDASSPACAQVMDQLATQPDVHLVRLAVNQGKGGAVMAGLREAGRLGFSHALQVDADGQHDLADVQRFLAAAQARPGELICGYPQYDESVPKSRLYARYLTHVWVWINSLSLSIRDGMRGFRVYPWPRPWHSPKPPASASAWTSTRRSSCAWPGATSPCTGCRPRCTTRWTGSRTSACSTTTR